ncbi:MAG: hypothetical protein VX394_04820, partial [Pseudomonadota bacterium]|nr:hypothetical protein [Pseudomonadota bacterium]
MTSKAAKCWVRRRRRPPDRCRFIPTSPISGARKARGGPPRWEGSATIAARVTAARARQSARGDGLLNARVDGAALTAVCAL